MSKLSKILKHNALLKQQKATKKMRRRAKYLRCSIKLTKHLQKTGPSLPVDSKGLVEYRKHLEKQLSMKEKELTNLEEKLKCVGAN